jgi:hypothetical protein
MSAKPDNYVERVEPGEPTGWVGFAIFAGILLIMAGGFNVIYGLVALFKDELLVATRGGLLAFDTTQWGWITLLFGIFQVAVGLGILAGQSWARLFGVIAASLNAIAQLALLPAQPVWSTIIIAMNVLVIYALTVHGRELRA